MEPVADEGVPVLPDIVEAVREVERSFHEAQVPSEPILALMKSGTSQPVTAPRPRISVPTQDPQDRPEGWRESKKHKVVDSSAPDRKGTLADYKAKWTPLLKAYGWDGEGERMPSCWWLRRCILCVE